MERWSEKGTQVVPENQGQKQNNESQVNRLVRLLLSPHKTIRDAVHGDIMVTRLEVNILDTRTFQRLRGVKQLGPTNLIYPSANHSRFEHSLGTLFMAQRMIDAINSNPFIDVGIEPIDQFVTRLSALLHDVCHIPFGHTLEDEGNLFPRQWEDTARIEHMLGESSEIGKVVLSDKVLSQLASLGGPDFASSHILKDIRDILTSLEFGTVDSLPKPHIADIVGNTLCADLLDYVKRDIYFTGIREAYDERFLSYLYVTKHGGKPRLVLRLIKPRTREVRRDVLSELLHLLRLRYSLGEKVYYHHSKIAASAMVISAVSAMLKDGKLVLRDLYGIGDERLLELIEREGGATSKHLVGKLYSHTIYKPVYNLTFSEEGLGVVEAEMKRKIIERLRNPDERYQLERKLEAASGLQEGMVVVYCPGPEMGQKAVRALVDWGTGIGPLRDIRDNRVKREVETSIVSKHEELWSMYVFVDPSVSENQRMNICIDCQELLGLPSASQRYVVGPQSYLLRYALKWNAEHKGESPINTSELSNIQSGLSAKWPEIQWLSYQDFCKLMGDLRGKEKYARNGSVGSSP